MVLRRVVRAARSVSERRVERDCPSEEESCCGFGWGWELEMLEAGLENGCRIEDIVWDDTGWCYETVIQWVSCLDPAITTTNVHDRHKLPLVLPLWLQVGARPAPLAHI